MPCVWDSQTGVKMKVCFQQNGIVLQHYESVWLECMS